MLIPLNAEGVYWCSAELLPATFYPFQTNVLFLYPLKMLEGLWFSDVFRGCRNRKMAWKGLSFFTGHFGQLIVYIIRCNWKHKLFQALQTNFTIFNKSFANFFNRICPRVICSIWISRLGIGRKNKFWKQ